MSINSKKTWLLITFTLVLLPLRMALAVSLLPLDTEQAETLPSGKSELVVGMSYSDDERFPYFTEPGTLRSQTLIRGPQVGFHIGAGDWAEIQGSYELIYLDETAANGQTNHQYGSGDSRIHTKVRVIRESEFIPSLGVRFGTKLPNANVHDRLGTDETDFDITALATKDFGVVSAHINLGLILLGDPGRMLGAPRVGRGQDDLVGYSVALVSAPLGKQSEGSMELRVLAEVAGQTASHFDNERSSARLGIQLGRGPGKIYLGMSTGLVTGSENIGARAGFIYSFEPAALFE